MFLARATGIPDRDAEALDQRLVDFILAKLAPITSARDKIFLPLSAGGLGFASVAEIACRAFAASWYKALPKVAGTLMPHEEVVAVISASRWISTIAKSCDDILGASLGEGGVLGDKAGNISQRQLMQQFHEVKVTKMSHNSDLDARAARRSAAGKGAGTWLHAPHSSRQELSNQQLKIATLTRLHEDIPGCTGACQHKHPDGRICGEPLHAKGTHSAACRVGGWRVRKHNAAVRCLAGWCEQRNAEVQLEQHVPQANANCEARLDLIVRHDNLKEVARVDVTIVNATVTEYLKRGSASADGVAARAAERSKRTKYSGVRIVPFVVEEHGRLGEDALKLVRRLAPTDPAERSRAIAELYQDLGSIIRRLSADAILTSMGRAVG